MPETSTLEKIITSAIESPSKEDVKGTVLDPEGGFIELPEPLINYRGREFLKTEDLFDPQEEIEKIPAQKYDEFTTVRIKINKLPNYEKFGIHYLNKIQVAVNRLLQAKENYLNNEHPNPRAAGIFLQKAFTIYEDAIISTLAGKNGIISRYVLGTRVNLSMITPVQGTDTISPEEVLIPTKYAKQIDVYHDDIIMVHREPLLWDKGIWFLKARVSDEAASTQIHWSIFPGMNADVDGDLMFLTNISKQLLKAPLNQQVAARYEIEQAIDKDKNNLRFDASLCLLNPNDKPSEDIDEDLNKRLNEYEGLSFGLSDVYGEDTFLNLIESNLGFDPEKVNRVANGFNEEEWTRDIYDTAKALSYTKRGLGPVGAAGSYCLILSTAYPQCKKAAIHIKEGLSQVVLDAKHGEDLDHIQTVLDALIKTEDFSEATPEERLDAVVSCGFPREDMQPLFDVLGDDGLISIVYNQFPSFLLGSSNSNKASLLRRFIDGEADPSGPGRDAGAWFDSVVKGE